MQNRVWKPIPFLAILLLLLAVACEGVAPEPIIVEKEVIKEVIKEIVVEVEVIKEVLVEVVVEKEVVRIIEVPVTVTPAPRTPSTAQECMESSNAVSWTQGEIVTADGSVWQVWYQITDATCQDIEKYRSGMEFAPPGLVTVALGEESGLPFLELVVDPGSPETGYLSAYRERATDDSLFFYLEKEVFKQFGRGVLAVELGNIARQLLAHSAAGKTS